MKKIQELTRNVLTEIKGLSTKDAPAPTPPSPNPPDFGFNTFGEPQLESVLRAAREFCHAIKTEPLKPYWLSLLGSTGTGKTMLARAIKIWVTTNCRSPVAGLDTGSCTIDIPGRQKHPWEDWATKIAFVDWRKLCSRLRAGGWDELDWLENAWLVVLDDIGTEYDPYGAMLSALDRIINGRLRKWTVITSNFSMEQIAEKLDVRIASRMKRDRSKILEIDVMDYALREDSYVI